MSNTVVLSESLKFNGDLASGGRWTLPYFGRIRSFGSLGCTFILASGYIILNFGYENMMWISVGINLIVIIVSFYMWKMHKADSASVKYLILRNCF